MAVHIYYTVPVWTDLVKPRFVTATRYQLIVKSNAVAMTCTRVFEVYIVDRMG